MSKTYTSPGDIAAISRYTGGDPRNVPYQQTFEMYHVVTIRAVANVSYKTWVCPGLTIAAR